MVKGQHTVSVVLSPWVLGLYSLRPGFGGRLISWCTNGSKSSVGGSTHEMCELERNFWMMFKNRSIISQIVIFYINKYRVLNHETDAINVHPPDSSGV